MHESKWNATVPVHDTGSLGYVVLLTLVAALGGLLFGYDTAVISGAIGFLAERFALNEFWTGWTASSALVGCILGAGCAGAISDQLGRRRAMVVAAILFAISAVIKPSLTSLCTASTGRS